MTVAPARRLTLIAAAILVGAALSTVVMEPAHAAGVGYARLAHLSPDTPPVDVYVAPVNNSAAQKVFNAVGYGVMSNYLALPPGAYAVSMRSVGAAPTSPPILSAQATIEEGKAYTIVGAGERIRLGIKVYTDDLGPPRAGRAKVRVIQASVKAPKLDVRVDQGETIATGVEFATTTDYQEVAPGRFTLRLTPTGGAQSTTVSAPLSAGAVYSLIVLDGTTGGLSAQLRTDAKGNDSIPFGGVDTGGGGTAGRSRQADDRGLGLLPIAVVIAALVAAGAGVALLRRRVRVRVR